MTAGCQTLSCGRTTGARPTAHPEALWRAATKIRLDETRRLGKLVGWRIPGVTGAQTYHELFRAYPFSVLEESEHRLISGLCGRIWTLARDYPVLDGPEAFAGWNEPGTVRVAFAHWVRQLGDGAPRSTPRRACSPSTPAPACG